MKLVIVESPAKAKTIGKYLGADYKVDASKGHIWDLPEKSMGIDFNNNYAPQLSVRNSEQKQTIERLRREVQKADEVYLATDPDREGEAISYHLQCALGLDPTAKNRIMFNEISKKAVNAAIQNPRYVNMGLVDAQQARRVLDRLVGYTLSPVLCKKISAVGCAQDRGGQGKGNSELPPRGILGCMRTAGKEGGKALLQSGACGKRGQEIQNKG